MVSHITPVAAFISNIYLDQDFFACEAGNIGFKLSIEAITVSICVPFEDLFDFSLTVFYRYCSNLCPVRSFGTYIQFYFPGIFV